MSYVSSNVIPPFIQAFPRSQALVSPSSMWPSYVVLADVGARLHPALHDLRVRGRHHVHKPQGGQWVQGACQGERPRLACFFEWNDVKFDVKLCFCRWTGWIDISPEHCLFQTATCILPCNNCTGIFVCQLQWDGKKPSSIIQLIAVSKRTPQDGLRQVLMFSLFGTRILFVWSVAIGWFVLVGTFSYQGLQ